MFHIIPQEMENLILGRFGKRLTCGVTAEDTVEKKRREEERSEVTGYLKGKENGLNIRNKMV